MHCKHYLPIGLALISLLSTHAWADAGWTGAGNVYSLNPTGFGKFVVNIHTTENPTPCKNTRGFYRDYGQVGSDMMYYTLLEALKHNKQVKVYITGGCDLDRNSEISSVIILR